MVLADLGKKITGAFKNLNSATVVDEQVPEDQLVLS
ncbi:hypothetical protein SARC_10586 [Sphaeroforma arctica JP610]|uniref:Uncharacterized protein n=1 Tax=Sphaeroforma arctica JP610 TaxID=667725 RepID=A0A0L0FJJ3_9EUKA|nr:hypothetical protein SARC_10586 [Sphaeroforma arctica JP610]KNC76935.1 hypothetical protein SARC_10586 [Sphaeroforma arctica JP610]|eukprot:XP_014150837.1 hypothetical protein SARC_10586 [Sphaeroforma arctica JP610]